MNKLEIVDWNDIKDYCDKMYCDNSYQTPYQSWEFLDLVGKGFQLKHPLSSMAFKLLTLGYYNKDCIRCILPLEISKNKKIIRMRGYSSSIGHLDFIYPADFTQSEYSDMIALLSKNFPGYRLIFDRISERSLTYKYSFANKQSMQQSECVSIPLSDSWETWLIDKVGSKTRHNIRRAYRDLEKDGFRVSLTVYNNSNPIDKKTWKEICHLFAERSCVHNNINVKKWLWIVNIIKSRDPIAKALFKSKYSMITVMRFNDELAAFGCGVKSNDGRFISMRHGVNMKYKDYQIGLIYTSEVMKELIDNREKYQVEEFDRSRGAEQHKIGVGGKIHYNYAWEISF